MTGKPKECPNCGEPFVRNKRTGDNVPKKCPECGKDGCTICIDGSETETCCVAPYDTGGRYED